MTDNDKPKAPGTPIEDIEKIRVGPGQWNFATFSRSIHGDEGEPTPEEIKRRDAQRVMYALRQLARGVEPPPAPMPVTRLLTEEEEQGYFTIGSVRVNLNQYAFSFGGDQADGKVRSALKRFQVPLEALLEPRFGKPLAPEVDYLSNAVAQIDAQCNELTLPAAAMLYIPTHDVSASLMPLPGTNRALYQVATLDQVLGSGLILERGRELVAHELRRLGP